MLQMPWNASAFACQAREVPLILGIPSGSPYPPPLARPRTGGRFPVTKGGWPPLHAIWVAAARCQHYSFVLAGRRRWRGAAAEVRALLRAAG